MKKYAIAIKSDKSKIDVVDIENAINEINEYCEKNNMNCRIVYQSNLEWGTRFCLGVKDLSNE